jgi:hypothetical protein
MEVKQIVAPITSIEVIKAGSSIEVAPAQKETFLEHVNEYMKRPLVLSGKTYQLKTPQSENTWYITINDVILNEGTEHESRKPFEIFINTKDVASHQWVVFASRMLSAVFRKGGDITFILDEMASVHQPNGGYLSRTGYIPSLVAEIGKIIEKHFMAIGLIEDHNKEIKEQLAAKKEEFLKTNSMANAGICKKCQAKAVVFVEGCGYCTECGDSRCS